MGFGPVVTAEAEAAVDRWEDPTRGRVDFRTLVGSTDATGEITAGVAEIPPGGWLGRHQHPQAEVYHVLAGEGVLEVDEAAHRVGPGSVVWIPGDFEHSMRNDGAQPLRLFYAFAVDSMEEVRYRFLPKDGGPALR